MMTAFISGASSGIGAEISKLLVEKGVTVFAAARRVDKLERTHHTLGNQFIPLELDISDPRAIKKAIARLGDQAKKIDLLVNNAGLALGLEPFYQNSAEDIETMIQTNILGLTHLTHALLPFMVANKKGYVINIGSVAANYAYVGGTVYGATKAFISRFSAGLRVDIAPLPIRVTDMMPGQVAGTEFSSVRFHGDNKRAQAVYEGTQSLQPEDIAQMVLWLYELPEHINVNYLEIMPVVQTSAGLKVHKSKN